MDPRGSVRVAMALFVVLLIRDGEAEDKALQLVRELPSTKLRGAFTWLPPEDPLPATGGGIWLAGHQRPLFRRATRV